MFARYGLESRFIGGAGRAALWSLCIFWALSAQAAAATVINGGFEDPDRGTGTSYAFLNPDSVAGWDTTDSDIEIWANGFNGVTSFEGDQHAEINAKAFGTLYQTVTGIAAGADILLEFAHRARSGTDVMRVEILDLGTDGTFDTADDTILYSREVSATTASWVLTSSADTGRILALGGDVRLSFTAVSTGSGSVSVGNFLDAVELQTDIPSMPGPAAGFLLIGALGTLGVWRRKRQSQKAS